MKPVSPLLLMMVWAVLPAATVAQDAPKAKAAPPTEKKTCRSLMPTGSIMGTRVCNTAAAWQRFDAYTAEGADQFRNTYRMTSTGTPKP
jgi:hypothetical protein